MIKETVCAHEMTALHMGMPQDPGCASFVMCDGSLEFGRGARVGGEHTGKDAVLIDGRW